MPAISKRRWYQFSLRTLLVVTTVFAVGLAWIGRERQKSFEQQEAVAVLQRTDMSVVFDEKALRRPAWLKHLLGDDRPGLVTELWYPTSDADLALVAKLPRINTLVLAGEEFTGVGFKHLASLHQLRDFHLIQNSDPSLIVSLKGLSKLESVYLSQTEVSDKDLIHLANLSHLRVLILDQSKCTGAGLASFREDSALRELCLGGCPLTTEGLAGLRSLLQLQVLDLTATEIGDGGLAHVANLTGLRELHLGGTEISDDGLASLSALSELKKLTLRETHITDAGLRHLAKLTRLEELDLSQTNVSGSGIKYLAKLPNIRILRLSYAFKDENYHAEIGNFRRLEVLDLTSTRVRDGDLKTIASLTSLRSLCLQSNTSVTDNAVPYLVKLKSLKNLDVSRTKITRAGLDRLRQELPNTMIDPSVGSTPSPKVPHVGD